MKGWGAERKVSDEFERNRSTVLVAGSRRGGMKSIGKTNCHR